MNTLEEIRHTMYVRSERWWWGALGLVATGIVAGLITIHTLEDPHKLLCYSAAVISALSPVSAAWAKRRSGLYAARADLCRRAFMYRDALGIDLEIEDLRRVALWPGDMQLNPVTRSDPYFSTDSAQGAQRLADAVAESAFYTFELARIMAVIGASLTLIAAVIICAALSSLRELATELTIVTDVTAIASVVATVTLALLFGEVLITALAYKALSDDSDLVHRSAAQFGHLDDKSIVVAMRIAEAYSIALAANLPIPNKLYCRNRDRIHRAYQAGKTSTPSKKE